METATCLWGQEECYLVQQFRKRTSIAMLVSYTFGPFSQYFLVGRSSQTPLRVNVTVLRSLETKAVIYFMIFPLQPLSKNSYVSSFPDFDLWMTEFLGFRLCCPGAINPRAEEKQDGAFIFLGEARQRGSTLAVLTRSRNQLFTFNQQNGETLIFFLFKFTNPAFFGGCLVLQEILWDPGVTRLSQTPGPHNLSLCL